MKKQEALSIVKTLSNSTHLKSEKDEAVRIVLETDYAMYQMSRVHLCGIIDYIYENYMRRQKEAEAIPIEWLCEWSRLYLEPTKEYTDIIEDIIKDFREEQSNEGGTEDGCQVQD